MRARLALAASHQQSELREVVLSHKPDALRQVSTKATVPVLVDTDGRVIEESLDIMLWALQRHDPLRWLPVPGDLAEALLWIKRFDDEFKPRLDRYKYPDRFDRADRCAPRDAGAGFIAELEQCLNREPSLSGAHWGLADAAIVPFVRQFAHTDREWFASQSWSKVQTWLANFEASPLFHQVMVKYPPWQAGQAQTLVFTEPAR